MTDSARPKRVRFKAGDVFVVPLGPGQGYGYCRYLDKLVTEFFEIHSQIMLLPPQDVVGAKVIFTVWVSKEPFASGQWPRIDHSEAVPRPSLVFYKQDLGSKHLFLYYQNGHEEPATLAQCQGLENAAVWSANHIEDRLRDHFAGRPNKWVELLKLKVFIQ